MQKLPSLSPASTDLGLGDMLAGQVQDETEEARRKRMAQMSSPSAGMGQNSPASLALFGGLGAVSR